MGNKCSSHRRACGTLAAMCAAILPVVAYAQDPAVDRIEAIERQIRGLQSELQHLKSELGEAKRQLRQSWGEAQRAREELHQARQAAERERQDALKAATAEPQTTQTARQANAVAAVPWAAAGSEGVKVSMPGGRPTIATADGRASLAIGGLVQFDLDGYFQNPNSSTQFPRLNDGVNLHRGRLYFVGKFDDFTVNITPDFGGSPDGAPTLYEANINYTGFKPVTATVGYFHPLVSLSDATFPGDLLFLERASIINIERSVAADKQRASLGVNAATEDYFASAYLTGPLFGAQRPTLLNGEQVGLVGRLATRPYHDEDWNIHAEFSDQIAFHPNVNANGAPGVSCTTLTPQTFPSCRSILTRLSILARCPRGVRMFTAARWGSAGVTCCCRANTTKST
jgi:phosphate-selective porin OprO and OprP